MLGPFDLNDPTFWAFVGLVIFLVFVVGCALAGLAGAIEVAGRAGYVTLDMSPGYGYSGIVIAMLAALNPLGVVAAAVFVAGILVGADGMSRAVGVPTYIADVIVAVSLLAMLVAARWVVPDLSWPGLLIGLVLVLKVYWLGFWIQSRRSRAQR